MNDLARRLLILDAAGRLFRHYGPFKTTVADIAREARIGVGTVYLEFRNKDAILGSLSERWHERVLDAERAAWAQGGPPRERIARVLEARFEAFLESGERGAHGSDLFACSCPAIEAAHRAFATAEGEQLAAWLAELGVQDARAAAGTILIAQTTFTPPHVFEHPPDALREQLARLSRMLLATLPEAAPS